MQIAKQVYGINAAENAIIFFKDGSPAYITKRFDVKPNERNGVRKTSQHLLAKQKTMQDLTLNMSTVMKSLVYSFENTLPHGRLK